MDRDIPVCGHTALLPLRTVPWTMMNTTAGVWLNALLQPLARFTQAIDARHTQPTAAGTFSDAAET